MGLIWGRFSVLFYVWLLSLVFLIATIYFSEFFLLPALIMLFLGSTGIYDRLQRKRAVLANFPLLGRVRFMMEAIRPELRQYFWESDKDELPILATNDRWYTNVPKGCLRRDHLVQMKIIMLMILIG